MRRNPAARPLLVSAVVYVATLFMPWLASGSEYLNYSFRGWDSVLGALSGGAALAFFAWEAARRVRGAADSPPVVGSFLALLAGMSAVLAVAYSALRDDDLSVSISWGWWVALPVSAALLLLSVFSLVVERESSGRPPPSE